MTDDGGEGLVEVGFDVLFGSSFADWPLLIRSAVTSR